MHPVMDLRPKPVGAPAAFSGGACHKLAAYPGLQPGDCGANSH